MEKKDLNDNTWQVQKMCTDIEDYELSIEKQKTDWACDQKRESWKWIVSYHGSVVASGSVNSPEQAQKMAVANVPIRVQDKDSDESCSSC